MLSGADAELARRDAELPGLATLLDPVAFQSRLRDALPDVSLERVMPLYTRYKPRTNCLVAFRLRLGGVDTHVYAKTYDAKAGTKLAKARDGQGTSSALGPAQLVLPDHHLVVFGFPYDAKLEVLTRLQDPAAVQRMMAKVAPQRPDLWPAQVKLLRYKPERRFVGHLTSSEGSEAALRFYTEPDFAGSNAAWKKLKSRGPLRLARRLSAWKRKYVMAIEWVAGRPLRAALTGPEVDLEAFARTGAALAALHPQVHEKLPPLPLGLEIERLRGAADAVSYLCPALSGRVECLAERLSTDLAALPDCVAAVHGDFYDDQVLLSEDQVVVLDLDRAGRGDPVADLGTFAAHLERNVLEGTLSPARAGQASQALLEGYQRATGSVVAGMATHTAAALLKQCTQPFRERYADWPQRIEEILERAESILADAAPNRRSALGSEEQTCVVYAAGATNDDFPGLADAVAPDLIQELLDPILSQRMSAGGHSRLQEIRVVRHKPGRRCLVRYDLRLERPGELPETLRLLGKMRRRGLDKGTFRLVRTLWKSGWNIESEDGISVPEPMGAIPELYMWLQRQVPGKTATSLLERSEGPVLAARIAEAAHKLHTSGAPSSRAPHRVEDELRILREQLDRAVALRPEWDRRIVRVLAACEGLAARIDSREPGGIHRDFYSDQLICSGHRLFLLDLDLYCLGDPALDIGNFNAHLTEQSLRTWGDPKGLADCEVALRERFLELAGAHRRDAVLAYETLSLARHIHISLRIPERQRHAESVLELTEERLDLAKGAVR